MKLLLAILISVIVTGCASKPAPQAALTPPPIKRLTRDDCRHLIQSANLAIEMGDCEMAIKYLNAVLAVDPDNAAANYYIGVIERQITEEENADRYIYPLAKPPVGKISI